MRKLSKSFISTDDFAGVAYDDRLPRAPRDLSGTLHRFFRDSNISGADFVKSYYEVSGNVPVVPEPRLSCAW